MAGKSTGSAQSSVCLLQYVTFMKKALGNDCSY